MAHSHFFYGRDQIAINGKQSRITATDGTEYYLRFAALT
jgi:hypothetical protein